MDAALVLVAEKGVHGFSLAEAARIAGVSVGAPYRHFADRDAVLAAMAEEGFDALTGELERAARLHDDPALAMEGFGRAYVDFATESPSRFAVMFASDIDKTAYPDVILAAQRSTDTLLAVAREFVTEERSADDIAERMWAIVHGVAMLAVNGLLSDAHQDEPGPSGFACIVVREWVAGLRATSLES